jgi:steroid delta-isomerase-like uncharacterized protein
MADMQTAMLKAYPGAFSDAAKVGALYATDATVNVAGQPQQAGREAIQQGHQQFIDAQTNLKLTPTRAWMKGNQVACEWVLTGTQAKEWMGVPASDKPWGFTGGSVFTLNDDGLITKDDRYFDMGTYMAQVTGKGKARPIPTPSGNLEVHASKGDATEDKDVAAAKSVNVAFAKADAKAFLDMMTDDVSYDDVAAPATMTGKKGAKAFMESFTKAFPTPKVTETTLFGVEDFTIDEYTTEATQKAALAMGPGMTIPNTKKSITTHTLEVLQWKDGKIVKGWAYDNGAEFMGQLGLLPKPGEKAAKPAGKVEEKGAAKPAAPKDVAKAPPKK